MNSKKLFKTLLWSLAGLTLVLSGCTKNKKPSSPSTNNSTSSSISSPDGSSSSSSDVEDATKLVIENLAYNYDGYSSLVSVWTDKYVNSTIAPETANVSNKADGRRDVPYDECLSKYRWIFAVDANGYIVYASFGTKAGFGSPNDDFYHRENAWDKNSSTEEKRNTTFPVFRIADDWEPWPAANADHWDFVIPEGGFTVSSYLGIADFVNLYNFITGDNKVSSQLDGTAGQAAIVAHAAGSLDNIYLYLDEDRNLVAEKLDNRTGDEEAYLFNEDGPSILFDKISDVLAGNQNEEKTIHGYVVSTFDNAFIIDDSSAASNASSPIYVYDETGTLIPKLEDAKNYPVAASNTVSVTGKYQKVNEKNIFVPTKIEVLSPYWACKEPSSFEVLDYDTQWVTENQNRKFSVKGITVKSIDANDPNKVTFEDANHKEFVGVNLFYNAPFQVGQKFDVYGILLVENGQLVFTNEVESNFKIYVTITVVDGTINGTDGATSGSYAVGSKITLEPINKGEGLRFTGWNKNGQPASTDRAFTTAVEGNDTYTAIFVDYSNISVRNGGSITAITDKDNVDKMSEIDITNTNGVYSAEIKIGYKVTFHADDREDYLFTGWYYVGDEKNVRLSTDTDFVYTVSNSNADIEARYVTLEETPEPIPDSIKPDKFNENITENDIVVYTDFEINGKLPALSEFAAPGDTKAYKPNNTKPSGWSNAIVVDKDGKIIMLAYAPWNGNGGGYPGPDGKFVGLTHFPNLTGKDLPFTVKDDWEPWPKETCNNVDWRVPEGGFIIAINGAQRWAQVVSKIVEDDNLLKEDFGKFTNTKLVTDYHLDNDMRIHLGYDYSIVIEKEKGNRGVVTPEYLNPKDAKSGLSVFTDYWVNGTIGTKILAKDNPYNEAAIGRRTIKLNGRAYVIGVNANGKIVYASYGTNYGFGGPSDGFYSEVGKEGNKNDMWVLGEDWVPYGTDPVKAAHYNTVIPEGGFVITASDLSDPGMLKIVNELGRAAGKYFETSLPQDSNALFETNIADGVLENFTITLTKMGKILINDSNVVEALPEVQVMPDANAYTVYTEQGTEDNAPIKSYIDDSRVAVIDPQFASVNKESLQDDKTKARWIAGNYLTIAVDSEGKIAFLDYNPGDTGTPYGPSYYRNSYYGFASVTESVKPTEGNPIDVHVTKEGLNNVVNPAFVVKEDPNWTKWGYYQEFQLVVPQGGFVVVANGLAATSFVEQIYGKTIPLNGTALGHTYENKYLVSDDTRLVRDPVTNVVTVKPGAPTFAYVEVTDGTLSSEDPKNIVYTNPVNGTTTTQYVVKINSQVTITPNEAPEGLDYAGIYEGTNPVAGSNESTYTFAAVGSRKFSCSFIDLGSVIPEKDYVYEELNPTVTTTPDKFTIFTDFEIQGTQSILSANTYGNVPEGRHGVPFDYIKGGDGHGVIVVNKDGYIIMAQTNYGGYGGPADGYYVSKQTGLDKANVDKMLFAKGDDYLSWGDGGQAGNRYQHYDYMLPEGGFAIFASITNPTFIRLINDLTGKVYVDTLGTNKPSTETIGEDGCLDKWYLSLTRTGDLRVQDRKSPQPEGEPVSVSVTVEKGTIKGYEGTTAEIEKGSRVTIIANEPDEGYVFAGWYTKVAEGEGDLVSDQSTYTFRLGDSAVSYVAKYVVDDTPVPTEAKVYVENASIKTVNEEPYVEDMDIYTGDVVVVTADGGYEEGSTFAKWQQDGVDVSSALHREGAHRYYPEDYTFTVTGDTKIVAVQKKGQPEKGIFDYVLNLDGYDKLIGVWEKGQKFEIGSGKNFANNVRYIISLDENGKIVSIEFGITSGYTVESEKVLTLHDTSLMKQLMNYLDSQFGSTEGGNNNAATVIARINELKDNLTFTFADGVLKVAKGPNVTITLEGGAKISKVNGEAYVQDTTQIKIGDTVEVILDDYSTFHHWENNGIVVPNVFKESETTGKELVPVIDDKPYTFTADANTITIKACAFQTENKDSRYDAVTGYDGYDHQLGAWLPGSRIEKAVSFSNNYRFVIKVDDEGQIIDAFSWDSTPFTVECGFAITMHAQVPFVNTFLSELAGEEITFNFNADLATPAIGAKILARKNAIRLSLENDVVTIKPADAVVLDLVNAKVAKVNDVEYVEDAPIFVGDKVEFVKDITEEKKALKWKVNDKDIGNALKGNDGNKTYANDPSASLTYTVSEKNLKVELFVEGTLDKDEMYVATNMDGYGTLPTLFATANQVIKYGTGEIMANPYRTVFRIKKDTGELTEDIYYWSLNYEPLTVGDNEIIILVHDSLMGQFLTKMLGSSYTSINDDNRADMYQKFNDPEVRGHAIFAIKDNDVITYTNTSEHSPDTPKATVTVSEDAKIATVNGKEYTNQQLYVGDTITVVAADGSENNAYTDFAKWQIDGVDTVARDINGVLVGDASELTYKITKETVNIKYVKLTDYATNESPLIINLDGYDNVLGYWEAGQTLEPGKNFRANNYLRYIAVINSDGFLTDFYWWGAEDKKQPITVAENTYVLTGQGAQYVKIFSQLDASIQYESGKETENYGDTEIIAKVLAQKDNFVFSRNDDKLTLRKYNISIQEAITKANGLSSGSTSTEDYVVYGYVYSANTSRLMITDGLEPEHQILVYDSGNVWKDIHLEDKVKVVGNLQNFSGNTPEIVKPTVTVEEAAKYKVTITPSENGNVTIEGEKQTDFAYDDSVTLKVAPADGFKLSSLKVNGSDVVVESDTYTFKIQQSTKVEAEFVENASKVEETLISDDLSAPGSSLTTGYKEVTDTLNSHEYKFGLGAYNQQNKKVAFGANQTANNTPDIISPVTSLPEGWTATTDISSYKKFFRVSMEYDVNNVTSVEWKYKVWDTFEGKVLIFESTDNGATYKEVAIADKETEANKEVSISYTPETEVATARYAIVVTSNITGKTHSRIYLQSLTIKGYKA